MQQKTKKHQNQGSIDKKNDFFPSPWVTYPDGSINVKIMSGKFSCLGTFKLGLNQRIIPSHPPSWVSQSLIPPSLMLPSRPPGQFDYYSVSQNSSLGILEQSIWAWNRVGIGLLYPARQSPNLWMFKEPRNQFQGIDSASPSSLAVQYKNPIL